MKYIWYYLEYICLNFRLLNTIHGIIFITIIANKITETGCSRTLDNLLINEARKLMGELMCNKIEQILQEIRVELTQRTLGPGYKEFAYSEHPTIRNNFFSSK